jgi:hypothetical protein
MTDLADALAALDAALDEENEPRQACRHYAPYGWSLEHEGEYAGMWIHAADGCRRPSAANLKRVHE